MFMVMIVEMMIMYRVSRQIGHLGSLMAGAPGLGGFTLNIIMIMIMNY